MVIFVIYDVITTTPEAGIMKVAWVLVTIYTGPLGLFLYLLSCREPIPGTHEKFISKLWKQSLGSEVHCLAGDATGIILAAIVLAFYEFPKFVEILIEYAAGFFFGLLIFQALFMKKTMGGTYIKAIKNTFFPEWLSMNMIMAGMIPVMVIWPRFDELAKSPFSFHFWAMMSLATIIGGCAAYPINQWLVSRGLKHGMMTVRKEKPKEMAQKKTMKHHHDMAKDSSKHKGQHHAMAQASSSQVYKMLWVTLGSLALGVAIAIVGYYA